MIDHLLSIQAIVVYISTILLVEHQRHFLSAVRTYQNPLTGASMWFEVPKWMVVFMRITAHAFTIIIIFLLTILVGFKMEFWYYPLIVFLVGHVLSLIYKFIGFQLFRTIFGFKYFTFFGGLWIFGYAYYIIINF